MFCLRFSIISGARTRRVHRADALAAAPTLESLEPRTLLSGLTLITHGFQADESRPGWMDAWAASVADRLGTRGVDSTRYNLTILQNGAAQLGKLVAGDRDPDQTTEGEIILTVDWAQRSEDFLFGDGSGSTADDIAAEILPWLFAALPQVGIDAPLVELPIHLMGHSRGGAVISELSRLLGERGVWVDQVTFLDPHPLTTGDAEVSGNEVDPQPRVYQSVIFADDYWRGDGFNFAEPFDFDGQPVAGSFTFELNESVLGGFFSDSGYGLEHSDVHLFHYGTINRSASATEDGSVVVPNSWYGDHGVSRDTIGFHYSRIGGGDLMSTADPGGGRSNRIVDGYSNLLGGAGPRIGLDLSAAAWPSLVTLANTGGATYEIGAALPVRYVYQDVDSEGTVAFFLDTDTNPYNAGSTSRPMGTRLVAQTVNQLFVIDEALDTTGQTSGTYFLYAAIADAEGQGRFRYLAEPVTLSDTTPPMVTEVLLRGEEWSPALLDYLRSSGQGDGGYELPIASGSPIVPLFPWTTVDQLVVRFSEDVSAQQQHLVLHGVNMAKLEPASVSYDPATFTATWTFAAAATLDRWLIDVSGAVSDNAGNPLSGGAFQFRFDLLPGDVNRSGRVLGDDVIRVRGAQFKSTASPGYDPMLDLNGSGNILGDDVIGVRSRQFTMLPDGEPALGASGLPGVSAVSSGDEGAGVMSEAAAQVSGESRPTVAPAAQPSASALARIAAYAFPLASRGRSDHLFALPMTPIATFVLDDGDSMSQKKWIPVRQWTPRQRIAGREDRRQQSIDP